ncbi:MAG TPA: CPBP family intramembrane glutamic endopeptidase [Arenimonas sp.]|uniref:CPBP family intramembrane glutamic endopeptidase n=1 Tax=Arenimonas sp. TaxID=1872635 RepID=UPI002D801E96|nr:CPBP family intramembrane glutamic endopeptidase [Arenimonas sp.]HEU0154140.1 CPBP family intramembrane glutamic endopeptidase [Arenimonas sp.]
MHGIFLNADRRLRNGWWMLLFAAFIAATSAVYTPISRAATAAGLHEGWREPLPFLLTLLVTWACLRLRRESLADVGWGLDRRWFTLAGIGVALGLGSLLLAAALIAASGGVVFSLDPARSVGALAWGAYLFLFVALLEENLFRGFLFQRLVDGAGPWIAQLVFALVFALGHWDNPGMDGITRVVASVELALASLMLGLAYLRTRSLALPVGLHFGWNWAGGSLMGLGVSGVEQAGWFQPAFSGQPTWLTGGAFGPEASIVGIAVDLLIIALLWRWKGLAPAPTR